MKIKNYIKQRYYESNDSLWWFATQIICACLLVLMVIAAAVFAIFHIGIEFIACMLFCTFVCFGLMGLDKLGRK